MPYGKARGFRGAIRPKRKSRLLAAFSGMRSS
jgi:hypothetical protein